MEYEPAISPDGDEIAYIGRAPDGVDVFVKDLAGGRALPLTADRGDSFRERPRWTPDGRSVVFSEDEDAGAIVSYAIPRLGGPVRTITASQVWDVHGNRVAYYSGDSILARDLDGGEPVLLNRSLSSHSGTWSPDGSKIAFVSNRADDPELDYEAYDLWVMPSKGGRMKLIPTPPGQSYMPSWSPAVTSRYVVSKSST